MPRIKKKKSGAKREILLGGLPGVRAFFNRSFPTGKGPIHDRKERLCDVAPKFVEHYKKASGLQPASHNGVPMKYTDWRNFIGKVEYRYGETKQEQEFLTGYVYLLSTKQIMLTFKNRRKCISHEEAQGIKGAGWKLSMMPRPDAGYNSGAYWWKIVSIYEIMIWAELSDDTYSDYTRYEWDREDGTMVAELDKGRFCSTPTDSWTPKIEKFVDGKIQAAYADYTENRWLYFAWLMATLIEEGFQ